MAEKRGITEKVIKKTESALTSIWGFIAWLTGILVSLAVGFGMASGSLIVPKIPLVVTEAAGWIVVILTCLGAVLKTIDKILK
jgi:cobalamin biosynthesis protein CobD/CbiB